MAESDDMGNQLAGPEQILQGLARELTEPLLYIARQAEFSAEKTSDSAQTLQSIEQSATNALRLIDSYLLTAQSEYGQKQLPLQTVGAGSILYDVAHDLRASVAQRGYVLEVDSRYAKPIMTNIQALKTALVCLGEMLMTASVAREVSVRKLRLVAYKHDNASCVISVLDTGSKELSKHDIVQARNLQGRSHMAMSKITVGSGIQFALADSLAAALNADLRVVRKYKMTGFGLVISKSDQLQLVG